MKCSLQRYHGYVVFLLPCFTSKAIEFTEQKGEEYHIYQKPLEPSFLLGYVSCLYAIMGV